MALPGKGGLARDGMIGKGVHDKRDTRSGMHGDPDALNCLHAGLRVKRRSSAHIHTLDAVSCAGWEWRRC